ncbi:DUF1273 domain-containing protein [Paenibacillus sp. GCM10023248]|uniref:DUF1273 domain-containing protein n=1 Tax=Bacillales TaxID=1385 RepID=UPI002378331F|nr:MULTISPECIES: DUF1273 domain-containing protein [Bacillales]MDD9265855.1 DUF1273 domain-containing protein [Paenibacillus sp. MAHUQ-63]MDR6879095.1 putative phage-like protein YoqJ [Bacillus sp. 3255]
MKRVLITGYKASELGIFSLKHQGIPIIKKAIQKRLIPLVEEGLEWVVVSGGWGVELWAAEAVLELQAKACPELKLAVITPFLEQEENWSDEKKGCYTSVLNRANYVNSITKTKYEGPWQFKERDKFLLRNSDGIILVYDEDTEGSPKYMKMQAVQLAANHDYPIITINANDLQNAAEEDHEDAYGDSWTDMVDEPANYNDDHEI